MPRPAETCSHEEPGSPGRTPAGWRCRPLARAGSRSQLVVSARPPGRHDLAPWVWPARTASYPSAALVQHPQVRRVRDPEPQVGCGIGRAGDVLEPVVRRCGSSTRRRRSSSRRPAAGRVLVRSTSALGEARPRRPRARAGGVRRCAACRSPGAGSGTGCGRTARSSRCCPSRTTPGTSSSGPSASRTAGTASRWARLSPVSTTRSGSEHGQSGEPPGLRVCPGVTCRSDRCRTRSGAARPAGPAPRRAGACSAGPRPGRTP